MDVAGSLLFMVAPFGGVVPLWALGAAHPLLAKLLTLVVLSMLIPRDRGDSGHTMAIVLLSALSVWYGVFTLLRRAGLHAVVAAIAGIATWAVILAYFLSRLEQRSAAARKAAK